MLDEKLVRTATPVGVSGDGFTPTFADAGDAASVDLTFDAIPAGKSVTVEYEVEVRQFVTPGETVDSPADVTYTSLPGGRGTKANPTGTATPGTSGAADGERDSTGGYADADAASFTTATPTFDKQILATGLADAGVLTPLGELAVGETVTFRLTATLTEGTTPRVVLSEQLPVLSAGVLEATSATIVPGTGGDLSGGLVGAAPVLSDTDGDGLNDRVTLDYGTDVDNAADGATTDGDRVVLDVVARLADLPQNVSGGRAGITREWWTGIGGGDVNDLAGDAAYPASPDGRDVLGEFAAGDWADPSTDRDFADAYGQRLRGYVVVPAGGDYEFFVSSNNSSSLRLSTDADPTNAVEIASLAGDSGFGEWDADPSQRSGRIALKAGVRYYAEALHKENSGGDHFRVGWLKPGESGDAPSEIVPGTALRPLFVPLDVDAEFDYGTATLAASQSVETVEPVLAIDQQASRITGDAGDRVEYTVTIAHAAESHANAFDVSLTDLLDADLDLDAGGVSVTLGDVDVTAAAVTTGNGDGDETVRINLADLPLGETLVVTYAATVSDAVRVGDDLSATASMAYDSHPDADKGRAAAASDGNGFEVVGGVSLAGEVVATSDAGTTAAEHEVRFDDLTVGETVTFELTADLTEATYDSLVLTQDFPDGLEVVSTEVISTGGLSAPALVAGDAGTVAGNRVTFDFGPDAVNAGDNDSSNDRVVARVIARVADVPQNGRVVHAADGDGNIAVEAEAYQSRVDRGGRRWEFGADLAGATGAGHVRAVPDDGTLHNAGADAAASGPALGYDVEFPAAGRWYVFVRGESADAAGNSLHVGLNGTPQAGGEDVDFAAAAGWQWNGNLHHVDVPAAGTHELNLWMREDGAAVDRFVLTQDADFDPTADGGVTLPAAVPQRAVPAALLAGHLGDSTTNRVEIVEPNLDVAQTRTPATADAGDEVEFTVVISDDRGTADARGVVVTDDLSANLRLVPGSVTTSAGTVQPGDGVRVEVGDLARGDGPVTITYRAIVADAATPGDALAAAAKVEYESTAVNGRAYEKMAATSTDVTGQTAVTTARRHLPRRDRRRPTPARRGRPRGGRARDIYG